MKYDVVVIGSGLGGLECAYILSRAGLRVLVLEQGRQPGGCLQSYRRRGLAYDTGFHYVGGLDEGQPLHTVFTYLGLMQLPWQRLDHEFDKVTIGQRTFAFAQGYEDFTATLAAEFPSERPALGRYAALLRRTSEQELDLLNPRAGKTVWPSRLVETSAWQYLNETFRNPLLVDVLSGTSLKMELRHDSLPLFTFLHGQSSFIESSWRLKGDGALITDRLVRGIGQQGGRVVCGAEVVELVEKCGRLSAAVCRNGEVYEGAVFISDIYPGQTCKLVKQSERMKNAYRHRMAGLPNTFGMFTVSLRMKPRALEYFNYNRYVYAHPGVWSFYEEEEPVSGVMVACRVPEDGSRFTSQVDLLTPMPWERCMPWSNTKVGGRGEDYEAMKRRVADECIRLAERVVPGLRGWVAECYASTPLTYRDYTGAPEGTAYGLRKDYRNPLAALLSVRTPVPNLFLTGQSLMLHGVYGVTMTALFTCAEVLGREQIWNILMNKKGVEI